MQERSLAAETRLIHDSRTEPRTAGAVVTPIYQSSTYELGDAEDYHSIKYIRFNNTPNQVRLARRLADLEGAASGLMTSSGMSAITSVLLALLAPGDHLITTDCLYGGTQDFIREDLARLGITSSAVNGDAPEQWEACLQPRTKAVYTESMTNPLLQVPDLAGLAGFARKHGLNAIIDNTFATPLNFRPLRAGFDVSIHSCSKYLNGHNDVVAGAVLGPADTVATVKRRLDHLGGSLDPHACFLLERGLKTLAVRLRSQERTAQQEAEFLAGNPAVRRVNYPGLSSHPGHGRASQLFDGFGAMMSFELEGGAEAAEELLARLTIPIVAPSLGGAESLILRPAGSIYAGRRFHDRSGVTDGLVRLSVGLEHVTDLIADFRAALAPLSRHVEPRAGGTGQRFSTCEE